MDINVYPNPTSNFLILNIQRTQLNRFYIKVVDMLGTLIYSEAFAGLQNQIQINTNNWKDGTYVLLIYDYQDNLIGKYKVIKGSNP